MAKNFKIYKHCNNRKFELKLNGDFDGSSAWELISTLKEYYGNATEIVIDTFGLVSIHPFGIDVFQKNYSILKNIHGLKFIGKYATIMTPGEIATL